VTTPRQKCPAAYAGSPLEKLPAALDVVRRTGHAVFAMRSIASAAMPAGLTTRPTRFAISD
jgi:hypothetical protein